jgi:thiamine-monophosphate kinase
MKVRDLGEDALVERLLLGLGSGDGVIVGPGDDCAAVQWPGAGGRGKALLLKTDCVVEGVHYLPALEPTRVGRKAMCRVLSDMAAMGGMGRYALVTVMTPRDHTVDYWRAVYRGLERAGRRFGVAIVGGETSASRCAAISVSMVGVVPRSQLVVRSGGRAGDVLFVTGRLGGSPARKHWAFEPRVQAGRWLAEGHFASAMMDISDGLAADLPRLARASGCGYEVGTLPRTPGCTLAQAVGDGEDYELLIAVRPHKADALEQKWKRAFPRLALTRIGNLFEDPSCKNLPTGGFQHFA